MTSQLIQAVESDPILSEKQKNDVIAYVAQINSNPPLKKLSDKFTSLSKPAQLLLAIAGFGIGKVIYDHLNDKKEDKSRFARYNSISKRYEIQEK